MNQQFPILPVQANTDGDVLEYAIFPVYPDTNLQNVLDYTLDLLHTWTDNYIWNLSPFTLNLDTSARKLYGSMEMGEDSCVSLDEWVVVGILWQVSKHFPDIVVQVQDSDGEFLLIESALHLPDWLRPETAENRVWIQSGQLQIIPLKEFASHDPPPLSAEDALKHLRTAIRSEGTTASLFTDAGMNTAIQEKFKGFPRKLVDQQHFARVMIPRLLAQVIHRHRTLISASVQSFNTRITEIKVHPCGSKTNGKKFRELKFFRAEDWVTGNVQFSRPLFAMIKLQKFSPPAAFPPRSLSASDRGAYELGIKLTCAFELLASSSSPSSKSVVDLWNEEKTKKVDDTTLTSWDENCIEPSNEDWMTLSNEDITRIMGEGGNEEDQVKEMIENLSKFMEGESGFEGIGDDEFDDEYANFHDMADTSSQFDSDDELD
jgi:SGT1 protein